MVTNELGIIKVCASPNKPTGNFLKACLRKLICNHYIDWDEMAYIAIMAYSVFPHSSGDEATFYLLFGCSGIIPTLFKFTSFKI